MKWLVLVLVVAWMVCLALAWRVGLASGDRGLAWLVLVIMGPAACLYVCGWIEWGDWLWFLERRWTYRRRRYVSPRAVKRGMR